MNSLDALVSSTLASPMAAASAARAAGRQIIGFISADVPVELIHAADGFALQLCAPAPGSTPHADRYLEASFAPHERSIAELWLRGELDFLRTIVFSRACDSSQRLYYYLCELQRRKLVVGPTPLLYDLPKVQRVASAAHANTATRQLAQALGSRLGELTRSIAARNRRRQLLKRLQTLRDSSRPPVGSAVNRIARAADQCEPDQFDAALALWLDQPVSSRLGPRIVLAGSAPPDERLHTAVEDSGGCVVSEFGTHAPDCLGDEILSGGNVMQALSQHYHTLSYGPRSFLDRAAGLLDRARDSHADAVIFWLLEEEEALVWDLPEQKRLLDASGIATLVLARSQWDTRDGATERVREFTAALAGNT